MIIDIIVNVISRVLADCISPRFWNVIKKWIEKLKRRKYK